LKDSFKVPIGDDDDEWLRMPPVMLGVVHELDGASIESPELWLPDGNGGWQLSAIELPRRRLGF